MKIDENLKISTFLKENSSLFMDSLKLIFVDVPKVKQRHKRSQTENSIKNVF